jgi:hypothetical protein
MRPAGHTLAMSDLACLTDKSQIQSARCLEESVTYSDFTFSAPSTSLLYTVWKEFGHYYFGLWFSIGTYK